jgi:hypothetical protein
MKRFMEWQKELMGLGAGVGLVHLALAAVALIVAMRMLAGG